MRPTAERIIRRMTQTVMVAALCLAVSTAVGMAIVRARGSQMLIVTSGSMAPTVLAGDAVLIGRPVPSALRPGTIVTFSGPDSQGRLTTHRISSLRSTPNGLYLQTKGDANASPDPNFVAASAVVGTVQLRLPYAGRWLAIYESPRWRLLGFGVPILLVGVAALVGLMRDERERRGPSTSAVVPNTRESVP